MKGNNNYLLAGGGFLILLGSFVLSVPRTTQGQGDTVGPVRPVKVVNTPAEPVSVTGSVMGNVNVINTPTVNAEQTGPWSVGIDPSANVVRVSDAARQPFNITETVALVGAETFETAEVYAVPAGKQLVVTYVTMRSSLRDGVRGFYNVWVERSTDFSTEIFPHMLAAVPAGTLGNEEFFVASVPLQLYLGAQDKLKVNFNRDSTTNIAGATFSFSGYLVDVP